MGTKKIIPILLAVMGVAGAGLSVAMLVTAINALEWGRVVLYGVTLAVCVEMAIINILKLRSSETEE